MKKKKNPDYGIIPALGFMTTLIGIDNILKKTGKGKETKKKKDKAESKQRREEAKEKGLEIQSETEKASAEAIHQEMAVRERLHQTKIGQSKEKEQYLDQYRAQLGFTGDQYDQVLSELYSAERAIALNTQQNALMQEQKEVEASEPEPKIPKIALYSLLGIAGIGALVYAKKRKAN